MRDIHIATEDDRLGFFERLEVANKCRRPFSRAVVESRELPLGVGRVNIHQEKIPHVGADDASFLVVLLATYAIDDGRWLFSCENRRAGVAGLDRRIPENLVSIECLRHLLLTGFDLLEADHIRSLGIQVIHEPLAEYRANAVDIP